jgi:hypothetical protein
MKKELQEYGINLIELMILSSLMIISVMFVRPLLEEWAVMGSLNSFGIAGYLKIMDPLRPLGNIPHLLQWYFSKGHEKGYAFIFGLMLCLKYLVARWAITPVLSRNAKILLALLATVLISWDSNWLLRTSNFQLASIFLFLALGAIIRITHSKKKFLFLGSVATFSSLATYQSLILLLILLPIMVFLIESDEIAEQKRKHFYSAILSIWSGLAGYALFVFIVLKVFTKSETYAESLVAGGSLINSIKIAFLNLHRLYETTYLNSSFNILFVASIGSLYFIEKERQTNNTNNFARILITALCFLLLLPLLSLSYLIQPLHAGDPDRVLYPVSIGVVLFLLVIFSFSKQSFLFDKKNSFLSILSIGILLNSATVSYRWHRLAHIQESVLHQVQSLDKTKLASKIVVRDFSGLLGDEYTFLPPYLKIALATKGLNLNIELCTPLSVDRIHPFARKFPISTTARCEDFIQKDEVSSIFDININGENDLILSEYQPPTTK